MDSATEFLFGQDVQTLSAALPYPSTSQLAKLNSTTASHPANRFAEAFLGAQVATSRRGFRGPQWGLFEFWKDEVEPYMEIVRGFIDPIIKSALEEKRNRLAEKGSIAEEETLLSHMVNLTAGMFW